MFYRHSFYYERAKKILFIRKERLESIGEFILVIVHCLSHIANGDLADDSQPMFLRYFYKVSRAVALIITILLMVNSARLYRDITISSGLVNSRLVDFPTSEKTSTCRCFFPTTRKNIDISIYWELPFLTSFLGLYFFCTQPG